MQFIKKLSLAFLLMTTTATFAFAQTAAVETQQTSTTVQKLMVKVKGVGCHKDIAAIAKNVKELDGVSACESKSKGALSTFEVKFDPALVTEKQIHAAIEGTAGCENPNDRPYTVKL
ncbi:MAG: cation transporter [Bacteroidota bacterium]